jgi:hypothetical protein
MELQKVIEKKKPPGFAKWGLLLRAQGGLEKCPTISGMPGLNNSR